METGATPRTTHNILRLHDVEKRTGLRRATIYRRASGGTFPKPIRLGPNSAGWIEAEIEAWLAERIAERDAQGESE